MLYAEMMFDVSATKAIGAVDPPKPPKWIQLLLTPVHESSIGLALEMVYDRSSHMDGQRQRVRQKSKRCRGAGGSLVGERKAEWRRGQPPRSAVRFEAVIDAEKDRVVV